MSKETSGENLPRIRELAVAKALLDIVIKTEKGESILEDVSNRFEAENPELFFRIKLVATNMPLADPDGFSSEAYMWGSLFSYAMLGNELSIRNSVITQLPQINIEVLNTSTNDSLDVESNSQGIKSLTNKLKVKILEGESPVDALFSVVENEGITEAIENISASIKDFETNNVEHLFEDFPTLKQYIDVLQTKYGEVVSKSFLQGVTEVYGSFRTHNEIERISKLLLD